MKARETETIKLLAQGLNTMAVNTAVVGTVTPLVAFVYHIPAAPAFERLMPVLLIWSLFGFMLHLAARMVLKGLDP